MYFRYKEIPDQSSNRNYLLIKTIMKYRISNKELQNIEGKQMIQTKAFLTSSFDIFYSVFNIK